MSILFSFVFILISATMLAATVQLNSSGGQTDDE